MLRRMSQSLMGESEAGLTGVLVKSDQDDQQHREPDRDSRGAVGRLWSWVTSGKKHM